MPASRGTGPWATPPSRIGPYLVKRVIARGREEVTCLGRDPRREGQPVLIHVLARAVETGDAAPDVAPLVGIAERFAAIEHPNLARLLEVGVEPPGLVYAVVERPPGRPLARILAEATEELPSERVVAWADELAAAVDHLHDHELLHGAIAPERVYIGPDGTARLGAPGPAALLRQLDADETQRRMLLGEPLAEEPTAVDDLAALAATLYRALGGADATAADPEAPAPELEPIPGRSLQINLALLAAMSGDAEFRPARGRDLVQALHGAPLPHLERALRLPSRRRLVGANAVAVALAAAMIGYGVWLWYGPLSGPAVTEPPPAETGLPPLQADEQPEPRAVEQPKLAVVDRTFAPRPVERSDETAGLAALIALEQEIAPLRERAANARNRANPAVARALSVARGHLELAEEHKASGRYAAAAATCEAARQSLTEAVTADRLLSVAGELSRRVRARFEEAISVARSAPVPPRHGATRRTACGLVLVFLESGTFRMGSPQDEPGRDAGETAREITLTRGLWMSTTEVTRGQFAAFVLDDGYVTDAEREGWALALGVDGRWRQVQGLTWRDPGFVQTDGHPVVCVSLNDARAFCRWLGEAEGAAVRLPTEAEWEYACRAGTGTAWSFDATADARANLAGVEFGRRYPAADVSGLDDGFVFTSPAASYPANAWGLFDMHGNAQEWCRDRYAPYDPKALTDPDPGTGGSGPHVLRGGSFASAPAASRSAQRDASPATARFSTVGFRLVMEE